MQFLILGPVRVETAEGTVRLSNKQRAVLGALLLHPGRTLSREHLIAAVWETPPESAAANLQTYVSLLRRAARPTALELHTDGHGYRAHLPADQLDLLVFEDSVRRAREARHRGDPEGAERAYAQAVGLWRGSPVEDAGLLDGMEAARIAGLEELLAVVRSEWIDVRIALGRGNVVPELRTLLAEHPLREQSWAQLIRALHQDGRRDEALRAFREARTLMATELGVEPGSELRNLHRAVLAGEPAASRERPAPDQPYGHTGLCQLPADIADFIGRREEVTALLSGLRPSAARTSPAIAVVSGIPGVGKTTLAVHLAHLLRSDYPDGQLFVRAHADPAEWLTDLLRSLGLASPGTGTVEYRARLLRQRLADRAVLLVLDDLETSGALGRDLLPLLPGTARSAVIVTSRAQLPALPGVAVRMLLQPPDEADARALLESVAGPERIRDAGPAADTIVQACGRLPLALRAAGARLAVRPRWPAGEFARRLADRRLDELVVGGIDVRGAFEAGYTALPPAARRAFRLLGLMERTGFALWSAAALLRLPEREADEILETLVARGMLLESEVGADGRPRYRLHDLMRVYAQERATAEETDGERRAAERGRLLACLERLRRAVGPLPVAMAAPYPAAAGEHPCLDESLRWLTAERGTLIAAVRTAVDVGETAMAAELAQQLTRYLILDGFLDDCERVQRIVLEAADDEGTALRCRLHLAHAARSAGRIAEAEREADDVLRAYRRLRDPHGEVYARMLRAECRMVQDRTSEAFADAWRAVFRLRALGDDAGADRAWTLPVWLLLDLGEYELAVRICEGRLLATRQEDHAVRADLLRGLGQARHRQGDPALAVGHYADSLRLWRTLGSPLGCARVLRRMGDALGALGRFGEASDVLAESAQLFGSCGDEAGRALAEYTLASLRMQQGIPQEARDRLLGVLERYGPHAPASWRARALRDLGLAHAALGDRASARVAWERARVLFGPAPEAEQVAGYLSLP